jgi:hypothetical protein
MNWLRKLLRSSRTNSTADAGDARVRFGPCLLCGEQIAEVGPDPLWLQITPRGRRPVVWFAHTACLAQRISPRFPRIFIDDEADQWLNLPPH